MSKSKNYGKNWKEQLAELAQKMKDNMSEEEKLQLQREEAKKIRKRMK